MSILIKDMKMPQNCCECPFEKDVFYNRSDDTICAITGKLTGINKCPLVEIPPHGRLIDADALMRVIPREEMVSMFAVSNTPAIIDAEVNNNG